MRGVSLSWPDYLAGRCRVDGRRVWLSRQKTDMLLMLLLSDPRRYVPTKELIELVWPDPDVQPLGAIGHLSVLAARMRRLGIGIESGPWRGYRIPREARGQQLKLAA